MRMVMHKTKATTPHLTRVIPRDILTGPSIIIGMKADRSRFDYCTTDVDKSICVQTVH